MEFHHLQQEPRLKWYDVASETAARQKEATRAVAQAIQQMDDGGVIIIYIYRARGGDDDGRGGEDGDQETRQDGRGAAGEAHKLHFMEFGLVPAVGGLMRARIK